MAKRVLFTPHSGEKQQEYQRMARLQYDPALVNTSIQRWAGYSSLQKEAIGEEGNQVYSEIVDAIEAGAAPEGEIAQALMARWHAHLHYFYEPSFEVLRGLGELYTTDPAFIANFAKAHPRLAEYMREAITVYVDALETVEIERLLAEDDEGRAISRLS